MTATINNQTRQFATALVEGNDKPSTSFPNCSRADKELESLWTKHQGVPVNWVSTSNLCKKYLAQIKSVEELQALQGKLTTTSKKVLNVVGNLFKFIGLLAVAAIAVPLDVLCITMAAFGGSTLAKSVGFSFGLFYNRENPCSGNTLFGIIKQRFGADYQQVIKKESAKMKKYQDQLNLQIKAMGQNIGVAQKIIKETNEKIETATAAIGENRNELSKEKKRINQIENLMKDRDIVQEWLDVAMKFSAIANSA